MYVFCFIARPCSLDGSYAETGKRGVAMKVLIFGDLSTVSYHLARRMLRDGHWVTFIQYVDRELRLSAHNSQEMTDRLVELTAMGKRFSVRHTKTCETAPKVLRYFSPGVTQYSYIVFATAAWRGSESPGTAIVRQSMQCLSSLLEETRLYKPKPIFIHIVNAYDAVARLHSSSANDKFASVMDIAMKSVLNMYWSLHKTPAIHVKLVPGVEKQMSMASSGAPLVKEVTSSIISAMQTRCEDTNNDPKSLRQPLMPKSQLPSAKASNLSLTDTAADVEDIVLTTYLTSKKDPQRGVFVSGSNYSYVSEWHQSLRDVGINGVVFHDGLTPEFRCVRFLECEFIGFIGNHDRKNSNLLARRLTIHYNVCVNQLFIP